MKKQLLYFLLLTGMLIIAVKLFADFRNSSQPPTGFTGAPGESTCANCHSGGSYTGEIIFEFGDNETLEYEPGQTYVISFTNDYDAVRFGFSMTALDQNNDPAGDFTLTNTDNTSFQTASNRQYVGHQNADANNTWTFEWQAPDEDVGDITFYYVINAANGDNTTAGDFITTGTTTIEPLDLQDTFAVTFELDLSEVSDYFNPEVDVFYITGGFLEWAEPGEDPDNQTMTRVDDSWIWTNTLQLEPGEYEYKFFINEGWEGGEWEGDPNREITIEDDMVVQDVWAAIPGGEPDAFSLVLMAQPEEGGIVEGEGTYLPNASVFLFAEPAENFSFIHWIDPEEEVISDEPEFGMFMPRMETVYTAVFEQETSVPSLEDEKLLVYPNPASHMLWVEFESKGRSTAVLYDLQGREVDQVHIDETGKTKISFQVDKLLPGLYFIGIRGASGYGLHKVMIQP